MIDWYNEDLLYFYHLDALGNVAALLKMNGQIVERYAYDAFGKCTVHTGAGTDGIWMTADDPVSTQSAKSNPFLFTGRQYDPETGLYYYRARMYSPSLGRFLQTDPIGYADSMNLYGYCGNNPITRIDPYGNRWLSRTFLSPQWNDPFVVITTNRTGPTTYKVNSINTLTDVIRASTSSGQKITEFRIIGHGYNGGLGVGEELLNYNRINPAETWRASAVASEVYNFKDILTDRFDPQVVIKLQMCNSASGGKSAAKAFKDLLPRSTVFGYSGIAFPYWTTKTFSFGGWTEVDGTESKGCSSK